MRNGLLSIAGALAWALAPAACSSSSTSVPDSGAPDSMPDTTVDSTLDSSLDATADATDAEVAADTSSGDVATDTSLSDVATDTSPGDVATDTSPADVVTDSGGLSDARLVEIVVGGDPQFIVAGDNDDLWFTECQGNKIGRLTTSGALTEYTVPTAASCPWEIAKSALATGTGGAVEAFFFTERGGNKIGAVTATGDFVEFPIPTAGTCPSGLTTWPTDGRLWFTENCDVGWAAPDRIGSLDPYATPNIVEIPTQVGGASLTGIAAGSDGYVWYAVRAPSQGQIGRYKPSGGGSMCVVPEWESEPMEITAGPDGRMWFTEYAGNAIGVVDPAKFNCFPSPFTEFPLSASGSHPVGIAVGPPCDGTGRAVWFAEEHGAKLGCVTTAGNIHEYPVSSSAWGITEGPDGNLWFTEPAAHVVGRLLAP
ncbi:MAG: hypothetical protein ACHREM_21695 [Polyangiales bacterium]